MTDISPADPVIDPSQSPSGDQAPGIVKSPTMDSDLNARAPKPVSHDKE